MAKVIRAIVGYGLLLFVSIPLACRLAAFVPYEVAAFGCVAFAIGAAWPKRHTAESLAMSEDIFGALADIGMSEKEAALAQEITPSQFSAQRVGRETFNASRLPQCGAGFMVAWIKRMGKRYGLLVMEKGEVADLLSELRSQSRTRREAA